MSIAQIQDVISELAALPDSDQGLVLSFLQALKRKHETVATSPPRQGCNHALKQIDGLLIFTGEVQDPSADWVQVVRSERDDEIMCQTLGPNHSQ